MLIRLWMLLRLKRDPAYPLVDQKLKWTAELHEQTRRINSLRLKAEKK